jgi:hypothetical protein
MQMLSSRLSYVAPSERPFITLAGEAATNPVIQFNGDKQPHILRCPTAIRSKFSRNARQLIAG